MLIARVDQIRILFLGHLVYIHTHILISSFTMCIKIEIRTQKKHMLVNVSAKAFISNDTDEGFGRNVYKHVFFQSTYKYTG